MPGLYAVGVHRALMAANASLAQGEELYAFLDDTYVTTSPDRTAQALRSLQAALKTHANIDLHWGKIKGISVFLRRSGPGSGSGRVRVRIRSGPGPAGSGSRSGSGSGVLVRVRIRVRVRIESGSGPGPTKTSWMLWSPYALGTRTELCFGHGCSGHRILMKHERIYALGIDVLVRNYALGMDASVTVCSWNTNGIMLWAWMLLSPYALGTRTELCFGHGCFGHRMLLEHERNYALGMDALVTVCSWNTNGIMLWAWMLWSPYAFGTRAELCFGHGCSCHRMLLEHERNYALGMDALVTACLGTRTELCVGHGCSGHRMLLEHERNYALGMDALVTACLGTRTELCFGHG